MPEMETDAPESGPPAVPVKIHETKFKTRPDLDAAVFFAPVQNQRMRRDYHERPDNITEYPIHKVTPQEASYESIVYAKKDDRLLIKNDWELDDGEIEGCAAGTNCAKQKFFSRCLASIHRIFSGVREIIGQGSEDVLMLAERYVVVAEFILRKQLLTHGTNFESFMALTATKRSKLTVTQMNSVRDAIITVITPRSFNEEIKLEPDGGISGEYGTLCTVLAAMASKTKRISGLNSEGVSVKEGKSYGTNKAIRHQLCANFYNSQPMKRVGKFGNGPGTNIITTYEVIKPISGLATTSWDWGPTGKPPLLMTNPPQGTPMSTAVKTWKALMAMVKTPEARKCCSDILSELLLDENSKKLPGLWEKLMFCGVKTENMAVPDLIMWSFTPETSPFVTSWNMQGASLAAYMCNGFTCPTILVETVEGEKDIGDWIWPAVATGAFESSMEFLALYTGEVPAYVACNFRGPVKRGIVLKRYKLPTSCNTFPRTGHFDYHNPAFVQQQSGNYARSVSNFPTEEVAYITKSNDGGKYKKIFVARGNNTIVTGGWCAGYTKMASSDGYYIIGIAPQDHVVGANPDAYRLTDDQGNVVVARNPNMFQPLVYNKTEYSINYSKITQYPGNVRAIITEAQRLKRMSAMAKRGPEGTAM